MHGVLRAHGKRYWIVPYASAPQAEARRLSFHDARAAALFLRQLASSDRRGYDDVRRFVARRRLAVGAHRSSEDALLDALARSIASSELTVHVTDEPARRFYHPEPVEDALPPRFEEARAPSPVVEVPPPPAARAPEFADVEAQAAALRSAAEDGKPFCEECAKAREAAPAEPSELAATAPEAQAEALAKAAETGAPFCEECEKAARAASAEAPGDFAGSDAEAQAEALVEAAETGAPFCEECEKARVNP